MHPLLYRNGDGEVVILWRRLVLWITLLVCATLAVNFAIGYFVRVRFRTTTIGLPIVVVAVTWVWLLYFARRHAQGKLVQQVTMMALLGGITTACFVFAFAAWDRQSRLQEHANRERLEAEIMTIVVDGKVRVSGNPGTTFITVKRRSFNDNDLVAVLQLTGQLDQANAPITHLDLSGTTITDHGVSSLANLESLEYCFLERTQVSDTSIDMFELFPKLKVLSVMRTPVTAKRLLRLSVARPELDIEPKTYLRFVMTSLCVGCVSIAAHVMMTKRDRIRNRGIDIGFPS